MTTPTPPTSRRCRRRRSAARAFTMVELLLSVAIVLVLMLGINQVFSIASRSIGAGQALSSVSRDNRAAHAIMYNDVQRMVANNDTPWLIIDSRQQVAFLDRADEIADHDANPRTRDFDANNAEGEAGVLGENTIFSVYDERNHRVDIFNFFMRGDLYRRSTGNDEEYINGLTSFEAYVSYGHMRMWNQQGGIDTQTAFMRPGEGTFETNPDNFHARNWTLGRMQFVMKEVDTSTGTPQILHNGIPQRHFKLTTGQYTGLRQGTSSDQPSRGEGGTRRFDIQESRFDLLGSTIADERATLREWIERNPTHRWWDNLSYRFFGNPYIIKPHNSRKMAQASPIFLGGCTQFIVEYAGDFLAQNPDTGAATQWYGAGDTDGEIDFIIQGTAPDQTRKIRWYGFPRNTDPTNDTAAGPVISADLDVVPLRDVMMAAGATAGAPFEKVRSASNQELIPPTPNYADAVAGMVEGSRYLCAWGPFDPVKPKMFRITMVLDDADGRLNEGQTYEYVIQLP
jgi:type II secretory pathway pseudopilin PulG